jgi:Fe-S cluster assembly protein SufD
MSTAVASTKSITSLEFGEFLSALPSEPEWLTESRRTAFESFLGLPWPTLKDEEWRRTDIRSFKLGSFAVAQPSTAISLDEINMVGPLRDKLAADYATGIVQIGGQTTQPADISKLGKVVLCDFQSALSSHGPLIREHLSRIVKADEDALSALHAEAGSPALYALSSYCRSPG